VGWPFIAEYSSQFISFRPFICFFSIATVIAYEYHQTVWVPIVCYTLAGFTAVCRLAVNDHWASDVLFGSAFGYAIGSLVYHHRADKTFEIVPVSSSGIGATLVFHL
jgi:membrane-associated phospholipid phosphatase